MEEKEGKKIVVVIMLILIIILALVIGVIIGCNYKNEEIDNCENEKIVDINDFNSLPRKGCC